MPYSTPLMFGCKRSISPTGMIFCKMSHLNSPTWPLLGSENSFPLQLNNVHGFHVPLNQRKIPDTVSDSCIKAESYLSATVLVVIFIEKYSSVISVEKQNL